MGGQMAPFPARAGMNRHRGQGGDGLASKRSDAVA